MPIRYRAKQLLVATGDTLSFAIGLWLSLALRNFAPPTIAQIERHLPLFLTTFLIWLVVNYINGLYDLHLKVRKKTFYRHFVETAAIALGLSITFFYILPKQTITPKTILLLNVIFGYGLSFIWRHLADRITSAKRLQIRVLFAGVTKDTTELIDILRDHPEKGYENMGVIKADSALETIPSLISAHEVNAVVIAPQVRADPRILTTLYNPLFTHVEFLDLSSFYEMVTGRIPPSTFSENWFVDNLRQHEPMYERVRVVLDYVAALLMVIILTLLFPLIAVAILATSPGPLFIRQKRVGRDGKLFTLYKFRSMYALSPDGSAEVAGVQFASKDDERVTPAGKILRRIRLDELPQVWNLLKRDVTLIGPRPERPEIVALLERETPYYSSLRHVIRPGLTGWALIHQDYTDTVETSLQKLQYDLYYIKNRGPLLDLAILLKTLNKIIRMKGQ